MHARSSFSTHARHPTYSTASYVKWPQRPSLVSTGRPRLCAVAIAASPHSAIHSTEIPGRLERQLPVMVAWLQSFITSV